ncbi:MAG: hypothetical protein ABJB69_00595 [Spartobacteria bacterium]
MRKLSAPIIVAIKKLIDVFSHHSSDPETLRELGSVLDDRDCWRSAKGLFDRIRRKTRAVESGGDVRLTAQYAFEEACAKTLYNLTQPTAPFDADSPYWTIPGAFIVASHYGIPDSEIIAAIKA